MGKTFTGDLIRKYRKEKGLTQKQLGERCGINEANIRKYELGTQNPKIETLNKIAIALNIPVFKFLETIYKNENHNFVEKFFDGDITPENITDEQLQELIKKTTQNDILRKVWVNEKENWAITEINKYLKLLSPEGQEKAVQRVEELTHITSYTAIKKLYNTIEEKNHCDQ